MNHTNRLELNYSGNRLSSAVEPQIEQDPNLLKAEEKLEMIKERVNYRYDLPDHRLLPGEPDYSLYMCRNSVIMTVTGAVEFFIIYIQKYGRAEKSTFVQLEIYKRDLLRLVHGRRSEMRTADDMEKIKELVLNITEETQRIYDMQTDLLTVAA